MVNLEQIKLLESKISRAIEFVGQVTEENLRLKQRNEELKETIATLKEEKTRMEEGITSALGKFNQFEDAIERSLSTARTGQVQPEAAKPPVARPPTNAEPPADAEPPEDADEDTEPDTEPDAGPPEDAEPDVDEDAEPSVSHQPPSAIASAYTVDEEIEEIADIEEELEETEDSGEAELDIF